MRVAVTGASGFVGQAVVTELLSRQHDVHAAVRLQSQNMPNSPQVIGPFPVGDIGPDTDWSDALTEIDCVIHCAARTHMMNDTEADAFEAYRAVNLAGTRQLAEQAAVIGVRRLIYLSSIKVNGEQTFPPHSKPLSAGAREFFSASDEGNPEDAYGISKWEAEQALYEVSAKTGLEVVIIRPPLVYGPGVKGNFLSVLRWMNLGIPLPLGAIHNQRSLVGIENLIDLIITCIDHPAAANQTFLVSDDEDLSTTELLCRISISLGKTARLIPFSASLIQRGTKLLGKHDIAQRLLGNLQADISHTKEMLSWAPPVSVDKGLKRTAEWYLNKR